MTSIVPELLKEISQPLNWSFYQKSILNLGRYPVRDRYF